MISDEFIVRVFIDKNQLTATLIASSFALIGPNVCYMGSVLRLKSVYQSCVLGRCVYVVFNHIATAHFLFFIFILFFFFL